MFLVTEDVELIAVIVGVRAEKSDLELGHIGHFLGFGIADMRRTKIAEAFGERTVIFASPRLHWQVKVSHGCPAAGTSRG